jgi:hypothetical protein
MREEVTTETEHRTTPTTQMERFEKRRRRTLLNGVTMLVTM